MINSCCGCCGSENAGLEMKDQNSRAGKTTGPYTSRLGTMAFRPVWSFFSLQFGLSFSIAAFSAALRCCHLTPVVR